MPKVCSDCGIEKDIDEFNKNKSRKDGHQFQCRKCEQKYMCQYRQDHKKEIAESMKRYRQNHKEKITEYERLYYQTHKKENAAYSRKSYKLHKKKIVESRKLHKKVTLESLNIDKGKRAASIKLFYLNQKKEATR